MARIDYYRVLEVQRSDSHDVIKRSYRRLARLYHPDHNQDDRRAEERFKRVVEAWEVLGNAERRRTYDRFGGQMPPRGFPEDMSPDSVMEMYNELFQQMKEAVRVRFLRRKGADLHLTLTLTIREALLGCSRVFELPRLGPNETIVRKRYVFDLPSNLSPGRVLRWAGFGGPGRYGGANGDLLISIQVEEHTVFYFEKHQLSLELHLREDEAMQGARIDIPSPWGVRSIDVQPGAVNDQIIEMPFLGGLEKDGRRAPLFVRLKVPSARWSEERRQQSAIERERLARYVMSLQSRE